jgi:hypothetical protein
MIVVSMMGVAVRTTMIMRAFPGHGWFSEIVGVGPGWL